jgi:hypothetical protein
MKLSYDRVLIGLILVVGALAGLHALGPGTQEVLPVRPYEAEIKITPQAAPAQVVVAPVQSDWRRRLGQLSESDVLDKEGLDALAHDIPENEWPEVLNFLLQPGTSDAAKQLALYVLERWAKSAPAEAAAWLPHLQNDLIDQAAYKNVAAIWAETDLASAVAWLDSLPDGENKTAARLGAASQAAEEKEPVTALKILSTLPSNDERDRWVKYAIQQWATTDRDGAVAYLNQIQNANFREELLGKITLNQAVTDPAAAAAFAVNSLPPGAQQETAVAQCVRFWAVQSPEQAAGWVSQLPEGSLRGTAMEGLIEAWARNDSAKAAEWLSGVPASPSRDTAASMLATILAKSSPDKAIQWAQTIQDEALRAQLQEKLQKSGLF